MTPKTAPENYFVLFGHEGEDIQIEAIKDSIVLDTERRTNIVNQLQSNGPFVMNNDAEIKQAYKDYYDGKFGYLED